MAGMSFDGANSKLDHPTQAGLDAAQITLLAWLYAAGSGESATSTAINRAIQMGQAAGQQGPVLGHQGGTSNSLGFGYGWSTSSGGLGLWTFPATDGGWRAVAVSYDRGSTANDPTARVDFAGATVTRSIAPTGTVVTAGLGYVIGNNTAQTRTWNGGIMHLQFHPTILSAANMDQALRYPGSVRTTNMVWWPLLTGSYLRALQWTGSAWSDLTAATPTSLTNFTTTVGPGCRPRRLVPMAA